MQMQIWCQTGSACAINRARGSWQRADNNPDRIRIVGFWGEGKTWVPREKPLGARKRTNNKLNPHMPPGPGIEPGTHWWEAIALTTAQSLLWSAVVTFTNLKHCFVLQSLKTTFITRNSLINNVRNITAVFWPLYIPDCHLEHCLFGL